MVSWVLEGAKARGAETQQINLAGMKIAPCKGCDTCIKAPNRCVSKDDMEVLQAALNQADTIVLGTPVYWWGPSAQMKLFVDRWYGFRGDRKGTIRGKRFGLVVPMGDGDPSTARHVTGMFQDAFDYLGCRLHEPVLAPGVNDRGDVEKMPSVKAKCLELGGWLAQGESVGD